MHLYTVYHMQIRTFIAFDIQLLLNEYACYSQVGFLNDKALDAHYCKAGMTIRYVLTIF